MTKRKEVEDWIAEKKMVGKVQGGNDADKEFEIEEENLEVIVQDVDRTMQEIPFFTDQTLKTTIQNMLYIWSRDNKEFGYRQGMNEILAMVVYAFFLEALPAKSDQLMEIDFTNVELLKNLSNEQIYHFLFNERHFFADIYWCYDRIMSFGMCNMFQITKDLNVLKKEIIDELKSKEGDKGNKSAKDESNQK